MIKYFLVSSRAIYAKQDGSVEIRWWAVQLQYSFFTTVSLFGLGFPGFYIRLQQTGSLHGSSFPKPEYYTGP